MKQHITRKQFNELTPKGKIKLREWIDKKQYASYMIGEYFNLSIGQMIEFLCEQVNKHNSKVFNDDEDAGELEEFGIYLLADGCYRLDGYFKSSEEVVLCDILWEAVKSELSK